MIFAKQKSTISYKLLTISFDFAGQNLFGQHYVLPKKIVDYNSLLGKKKSVIIDTSGTITEFTASHQDWFNHLLGVD